MLGDFVIAALTAIVFENTLFSRALGIGRVLSLAEKPHRLMQFGAAITFVTTLASALAYPLRLFHLSRVTRFPFEPLLYLAVMLLVYGAALLVGRALGLLSESLRAQLPLAVFNCAVLGTLILGTRENMGFLPFVGFGLGSGIGFTAAAAIVHSGNRALAKLDIPDAFRGLPAQLIYIGILSMAIYGFTGHSIQF